MKNEEIEAKWELADTDKFGNLTKREIANLISGLNMSIPSKCIYSFFDEIDEDLNGTIGFEDFYKLMERLRERPDMETLWDLATEESLEFDDLEPLSDSEYIGRPEVTRTAISCENFAALWSRLQYTSLSLEEAMSLVHEVTPNLHTRIDAISYHLFVTIISQRSNDAYDRVKLTRYQDMTRPLSHYYIAASFMTYLLTIYQ